MFSSEKGNVAKSLRLALGTLIIQAEYGYSDEEMHLQIQERRVEMCRQKVRKTVHPFMVVVYTKVRKIEKWK